MAGSTEKCNWRMKSYLDEREMRTDGKGSRIKVGGDKGKITRISAGNNIVSSALYVNDIPEGINCCISLLTGDAKILRRRSEEHSK